MNCEHVSPLLDSFADGEFIDAVHYREIESHLATCPKCQKELEAIRESGRLVRASAEYFRASDKLLQNIAFIGGEPVAKSSPEFRAKRLRWIWTAGNLVCSGVVVLVIVLIGLNRNQASSIPSELVSSHIRSLQATHLFDVASTDRHTVKPWFQGKLDFSPDVPNMASDGFPLLGGRLDYIENHAAAALVYRHQKHLINVFVLPAVNSRTGPESFGQDGYHIERWKEHGLDYNAVSDVDSATLSAFAERFRAVTSP